ncbi:MAG TPA: hypothetical protein PLP11_11670 [Bacteroidales bacterium]|nr:hypothetical protein [Bacteroidales bacterium]
MNKKVVIFVFFIIVTLCLHAQSSNKNPCLPVEFKAGFRIQKAQKLYWENGISFDFASSKVAGSHLHLGLSYVTSRLGSAIGSNAIRQDNYLFSAGYHFRPQKQFQPFIRINMGYFHADYGEDIFDVLPNQSFLLSLDAGLSYAFSFHLTLSVSAGYNLRSGNGTTIPGTLFPVFYQMSVYYTLL